MNIDRVEMIKSEPNSALLAGKVGESSNNATAIIKHSKCGGVCLYCTVLQFDRRFALTHFPSICVWTGSVFLDRAEAVFWKSSSCLLLFLRSRSLNNVCEHLVYKCLEYLIFVIKKNGKIDLAWLNFFFAEHSSETWGRKHHEEGWKGLFNSFIHGFPGTRLVLTILHTVKERKRDSIRSLQNRFSNISVILWKHQHYNQQQIWTTGREVRHCALNGPEILKATSAEYLIKAGRECAAI